MKPGVQFLFTVQNTKKVINNGNINQAKKNKQTQNKQTNKHKPKKKKKKVLVDVVLNYHHWQVLVNLVYSSKSIFLLHTNSR